MNAFFLTKKKKKKKAKSITKLGLHDKNSLLMKTDD